MCKKFISFLLIIGLTTSSTIGISCFDVSAAESYNPNSEIILYAASNPYPEHKWINIGTLYLDPVTINKVQDAKNILADLIFSAIGVLIPIAALVTDKLSDSINNGHTKFYVALTQYVSTDYQWHYYSYTLYEDSSYSKSVGSGYSQKWKDRYARSKSIVDILSEQNNK